MLPPVLGLTSESRLSSRFALGILHRRVEQLGNALAAAMIAVPPMDEADESAANKVLESVGLPILPAVSSIPDVNAGGDLADVGAAIGAGASAGVELAQSNAANHAGPSNEQQLGLDLTFTPNAPVLDTSLTGIESFGDWSQSYFDDSTTPDWLWAGMLAPDIENAGDPNQPAVAWNQLMPPVIDDSQHDDDADPEIVNQIAARFGSLQLAPDGKLRYFGTPANAHVLNSNRLWAPSSVQRSLKSDGPRLLRSAELDLDVGQEFEEHLTKIFFSWHNSCHPVVDEAMYWSAKRQRDDNDGDSGFCSEVLTSAMHVSQQPCKWLKLTALQVCYRC